MVCKRVQVLRILLRRGRTRVCLHAVIAIPQASGCANNASTLSANYSWIHIGIWGVCRFMKRSDKIMACCLIASSVLVLRWHGCTSRLPAPRCQISSHLRTWSLKLEVLRTRSETVLHTSSMIVEGWSADYVVSGWNVDEATIHT